MIPRVQKEAIKSKIHSNKIILIRGPKNAGKRELVSEILHEENHASISFDCSEKKTKLELDGSESILSKVDGSFIILNEAQHLDSIQSIVENALLGKLKQTLIICCSYTPQLDAELMEALHLEELDIRFYAPSFYEAAQHFGLPKEEQLLEDRLIYGNYPAVIDDLTHAELTLRELIQDVIGTKLGVKDRINKGDKLLRMMQLLAFEIGEPVSYNDIGERCGLDNETVERYIELLEDAFVLIKLPSYHTSQRYELKKSHCIYFQDNGIRNALISNFNPTFLRNDMRQLWANYLVAERVKWIRMNNLNKEVYFWRTHTRQQMDFIEIGDRVQGYKCDWEKRKKVKIPKMFEELYPEAKTSFLNRSTYWSFLSRKN